LLLRHVHHLDHAVHPASPEAAVIHLPAVPHLPAFLRRRPESEPWPRNPRTVADDLRECIEHNGQLAAALTAARRELDIEAARTAAAQQRAECAEAGLELARAQGADLHRELREVTAECDGLRATMTDQRTEITGLRTANAGLQRQLANAMGYDDAAQYAIATGTGQPRQA
jgi:flagellar biosynthesis/type III secretory pathway protein FliH